MLFKTLGAGKTVHLMNLVIDFLILMVHQMSQLQHHYHSLTFKNMNLHSAGLNDDGIGTPLDEFTQFQIKIVMQGTNAPVPLT